MDSDIVDQQLLQQFSCLGTTDKEELVRQLQILVGNNLSTTTAKFFLDMNNWSLQAAVGSYFDLFGSPAKLPSMSLIKNDNLPNVLTLPPSTHAVLFWNFINNGEEAWPQGCYFQFSGGDSMGNEQRYPVCSLNPNQVTTIPLNLVSPSMPGVYKSKWRMATPAGIFFGDTIWIIMSVSDSNEDSDLAQQLSNLNTFGDSNAPATHRPDTSCLMNPFGPQQFG